MPSPFALVTPSTRGLSLAITRHLLRNSQLPVYASHRSESPERVKADILSPLQEIDPNRLQMIYIDLTSEATIGSAAKALSESIAHLPDPYLHTAFLTGGVLYPEKQPEDLDLAKISSAFQINVISHLLLIKHFSQFLPHSRTKLVEPAKWVHVSARVGSISDNRLGGWYSYRASKAALNQVVKTFDIQLQMKKRDAICVAVHPGTVKTDLSREFWGGVPKEKLFEPENAAAKVVGVVENLRAEQRGRVWDWAGKEVPS
ncbi:NAD(P)-binding protein [Dendrothele bispora CBS 962.96]|uniref:NAD(P)-binding protein n=1 Tax=Dendrothele bispora (strain CBS 962.96) TaxID=1314807 RepID=A0A4S8MR05_DENBC|nr:NAD(P)-binding protein [Dendrothele bispora CBS 962.96]